MGYGKRPQRVQNLHRAGVLREHFRKSSIRHRALVKIGTDQRDAARLQPTVHLFFGETSLGFLASACLIASR
jgi:hypothetical protein